MKPFQCSDIHGVPMSETIKVCKTWTFSSFSLFCPPPFFFSRGNIFVREVRKIKKNNFSSGAVTLCTDQPTPTPAEAAISCDYYIMTRKHEPPVREQNSKLIMPYLAKCSLPTWNSDPHILLKGLYPKANYFSPLACSFLWKLSRQFWGPWQDQDETVLPFHLISSSSLQECSDPLLPPVCPSIFTGSILSHDLILLLSKRVQLNRLLPGQLFCRWKWTQVGSQQVSNR